MKYAGTLAKKERETIYSLFMSKTNLRFNEIEKALKLRSNMVSYHLDRMILDGLLKKKGCDYTLTLKGEKYLPLFSQVVGEEISPLPVVLVAVQHKNDILLIKRNARPYRDYWGLIGGKLLLGETIKEASRRLVKEKAGLDSKFISVNSILHEQVNESGLNKYGFILILTKVVSNEQGYKESAHGSLIWCPIHKTDKYKMIPSDRWLIEYRLNSRTRIPSVEMDENEGKLTQLRFV